MAQVVSSRNLLASTSPLVVGVAAATGVLTAFARSNSQAADCDLCEIRLDLLELAPTELAVLMAGIGLPMILTARHPQEGGRGDPDAVRRASLLEAHLDRASYLDIELRSALDLEGVIRKAQSRKIGVIGSFHDFAGTPSGDVLRGAIEMALQFRLDAVKIATTLRGAGDLARLLDLLDGVRRLPLAVMGMGPLGPASRLALAKCGSVLNYGHLGEPNAPGQWPARRLKELLRDL